MELIEPTKTIFKTSMDTDKAKQAFYFYLCGGYGSFHCFNHDYVHYLLCEICSDLSGIQPR